MLTTKIT